MTHHRLASTALVAILGACSRPKGGANDGASQRDGEAGVDGPAASDRAAPDGGDGAGDGSLADAGPGDALSSSPDAELDAPSSTLSGCALAFPYQDEPALGTWLGGDSAYSTLLTPTTALWSFQDTFVGKHGQTARAGTTLIANSFALVTCAGGVRSLRYVWGLAGGSPRAIFSDGAAGQRFWPQQPFLYEGTLFAAMTRVQGGATEIGTALARVANPLDPPDQWRVEYFELASISGLGKGTVVVGDHAYLFGTVGGSAVVTRLLLAELVKPSAVPTALLQYLASDGTWKAGLVTTDTKRLGFAANVGTSFRYLEASSRWLVLFTNTAGWPSADIAISTAPALEGPWSPPLTVYKVPEMTPGTPQYDADTVCYAAIEHAESNPAPETDLLFSYTCNSTVFAKQLANLDIYLPKIVRLKNPLAK
jgi:hypothetical protein